jgi:hypothetical protein
LESLSKMEWTALTGPSWPLWAGLVQATQIGYADPDAYPVDSRGDVYSWAFSSFKHLGAGQFYLIAIKDNQGRDLDGARSYRLTVPANAPVRLYWSVTVYDRKTHTLIRDMPWASRSSNTPGLQAGNEGAVTLYLGPQAPDGNESNWIPTNPGRGFEALIRFYGPEKPLFDKTWRLPDIELAG